MKSSYIIIFILVGAFISSCKKDTGIQSTVGSLNVVNATTDANPLAANYAPTSLVWSKNTTQIYGNSSMEFGLSQGSNQLNLISSADTTKPFFSGKLNLVTGGIYSLYIAGQVTHYDTVFMKDHIPYYGADSVAGARFINLATDSGPLSINQAGSTTPDFTNLAYKKITTFKKYPATMAVINNGGYNYEVRDAQGNTLTTFNWNPATFKNNTLVITGQVASGTVSVFPVNNY